MSDEALELFALLVALRHAGRFPADPTELVALVDALNPPPISGGLGGLFEGVE